MDGNLAMANQLEFNEDNPQFKNKHMKEASEFLYDIGLGLDPKSDELIIIAMKNYASQFKVFTQEQVVELQEAAYALGQKHASL